MEDLRDKIIELMDLFDGEVTTADKIDRPERALEKQAIDDFMKRNPMAGGGMLVQPGFGGTRQGYAKDDRKYKSAEEKYTGSAKPPKKKKWQGVFGKEKADEIYNDYVKFYTNAYNNKNMSQVAEATTYFKQVYGKDADLALGLLKRNGYTDLKSAPYKLKQKLLIELVDDAQGKIKFTNKFDIIDKVFTESAAKQARANGLSSFLGKGDGRLRLSWFTNDLFNKVDGIDKIEDKISKALDYMVENNIEIKDVKKATGSVFTQGTSAGDKSRMSPIKKTIVSLVDNGKDGISRALLNKGIQKNAWYQSQTQNGKNLFDYVSREYGTEFIGEGFLDAYESGKSRFGRVTVKGSTQMPLPESLIFQFAARSADRNFKAGTYEDGPVKITDLKGNELDFGSLPVNERGQRIIDPSKHKFTYNGTLYGKNNLRKLGYQSGDFTEVYQIASDFKSYGDELVPNPKNPNGKKIPFRQLMDMSGIDYFMAIGHDDSKGGVRTKPFNNFQIQNKFVNKSLDSAYRQVKNKDLRKRIADDIYGDLKGLRGQAYKDAWIKNNTKLLNDIILNRNIPPSLYRQAGENIIKSDVFQTFSKKKQGEVIRVSGLNKTQLDNLLKVMQKADPQTAKDVGMVLNSGIPIDQMAAEIAKIPGAKKFASGFMKIGGPFEVAFVGLDIANEISKGAPLDTAVQTGLSNITFGLVGDPEKYQMRDLTDAGKELGVNTQGFQELKDVLDLEKKITSEKQLLEDMKTYNKQTGESTLRGNFDINDQTLKIQELQKSLTDKAKYLSQLDNIDTLYDDYVGAVQFLGRKEYNKTVDDRKNRVYPDMGTMGSDFMTTVLNPIQSFLPQNLMETGLGPINKATRPVVRNLRKIPFIGSIYDPTSDAAKLSAMSEEEKNQRALDMNIVKQNVHPVMGQTMTEEQIAPYYEKFFAGGGIAGLSGGVKSGPPPESGPMSQGLQGLMKRGMKI